MGEQDLADDPALRGDAPDGSDLVAGPGSFDRGLAFDAGPCVVIEGPDDGPDFLGRVIEDGAVIRFRHARSMRLATDAVAPFPDIGTEPRSYCLSRTSIARSISSILARPSAPGFGTDR